MSQRFFKKNGDDNESRGRSSATGTGPKRGSKRFFRNGVDERVGVVLIRGANDCSGISRERC